MSTLNRTTTLLINKNHLFTSRVLAQKNTTPPLTESSENSLINSSAQHSQSSSSTSFDYIEEVYQAWLANPKSVHSSWDIYFRTNSAQTPPQTLIDLSPNSNKTISTTTDININQLVKLLIQQQQKPASSLIGSSETTKLVEDHLKLYDLIQSYQVRGHKKANLDPLGLAPVSLDVTRENVQPDLTPEFYQFTRDDLTREFMLPPTTFIGGSQERTLTLNEILNRLNGFYTRSIGLEYMYINNLEKCNWIRQQFEMPGAGVLSAEEKKRTLKRLIRATLFEEFLAKKWSSEKRFGLEGII
jgi:2-oxoglutarate dehydrogenase E1 component